jgi:hypothetical protein
MEIKHPCRLCKTTMHIEVDTDDLKAFQTLMGNPPDALLAMTVCNRCHDYHVTRNSILEKVDRIKIECERSKGESPTAKGRLTHLARSFCKIVSDYHRIQMPYDEQEAWIAEVASQPHNAWQSLVEFNRQAPHLARQQPQTRNPTND